MNYSKISRLTSSFILVRSAARRSTIIIIIYAGFFAPHFFTSHCVLYIDIFIPKLNATQRNSTEQSMNLFSVWCVFIRFALLSLGYNSSIRIYRFSLSLFLYHTAVYIKHFQCFFFAFNMLSADCGSAFMCCVVFFLCIICTILLGFFMFSLDLSWSIELNEMQHVCLFQRSLRALFSLCAFQWCHCCCCCCNFCFLRCFL